jgi:outer membrane protein assembly factor BamB
VQGSSAGQESPATSSLDEIRQMVASGNLQGALERYRSIHGVDLQEANEALEAIKAGRYATTSTDGTHTPAELTQTMQQIQGLLASGNKLEAIKLYRATFDSSLERAESALNLIQNGQELLSRQGFEALGNQSQTPPPPPSYPTKSTPKGCRSSLLIVFVVTVVIGVVGFFIASKGQIFVQHHFPQAPETLVSTGQDTNPQIASLFYDSGSDARFIGLVDTAARKLLWHAAPLKGDGMASGLAASSDMIYTANEDNLLAYHKTDGSLAWQTVMTDKLNYGENNMLVTAGRVITNNADDSIQAYDAETGSLVWSKRLSGSNSVLYLVDQSLMYVDEADSDNNDGLFFLDPLTGTQQASIIPTCTNSEETYNIETDSGLIVDTAAQTLFIIYREGCVQSLNLGSRQVNWTALSVDYFDFLSEGYKYLLTDSSLYFGNNGNLEMVTKSNGEIKILSSNPDYNVYPMEITGNTLIVRADRTRGTERTELWGVDLASGSQTWQITLQGASPIDPPNEMAGLIDKTDYGWTLKLTPSGLALITFKGEPNQLDLEFINTTDGSLQNKQTIPISGVMGDFYDIPVVIGWQGNLAYLNIDGSLNILDVSTEKLKRVY